MIQRPEWSEGVEAWTEYAIEWDEESLAGSSYTHFGRNLGKASEILGLFGFRPIPGKLVKRMVIRTEWEDLEDGNHV